MTDPWPPPGPPAQPDAGDKGAQPPNWWPVPASPTSAPVRHAALRKPRSRRIAWAAVVALLIVAAACIGAAFLSDPHGLGGVTAPRSRTGGGSGLGGPGALASIVSTVDPALVDLRVTKAYDAGQGAATGIVLTSSGLVLTNNHVVNGEISLLATDVGNGQTYQATVLGYDRSHDIALVHLNGASGLATARFGDSSRAVLGDAVVAVGNAGGAGGTPSAAVGKLTGFDRSIVASDEFAGTSEKLSGLLETSADIRPGDSGGPLVDAAGRVIGIDTASSDGYTLFPARSRGFAVPAETAMAIVRQIESNAASATVHIGPTAFLGVELRSADAPGALVASVLLDTPAQQVGLSPGDTIVSFGGHAVGSPDDLSTALGGHHPNDVVQIGWTDTFGGRHAGAVRLAAGPPA